MKLIGIKRLILLAILIGINAVIAAGYFLWVEPSLEEAQQKLTAVKTDISNLQSKIQNTKQELAEYQANLPKYQALETSGFMSNQDRFQISRDLDTVRTNAQLASFNFRIDNLQEVDIPEAKNASMKVINSRINIENLSPLLDINFFDFLDKMVTDFPSHVRLDNFSIERGDPLNGSALQKIAFDQPIKLVKGRAVFDWITYVPIEADKKGAPK